MKNKFLITSLLLVVSLGLFVSCEKNDDASDCGNNDESNSASVVRRPPPGGGGNGGGNGGGGNRFDICHYDAATNTWSILNIRTNQLAEHMNHGDVRIDDADNDGYLPANQCGIVGTNPGIDCNDNISWINPGAPEICGNDFDENCNGDDDDPCR